ncbi:unnamed protein product [Gongylonema pulchrum]|uniref:WD_REPEATS_REGION domain-containing protein n=1 Tax=Gongylonema pulchrum TaxID=637853 RepID=A0A183DA70_9BILA|nr:unnamed protein product [Gongylonema pulchrum]
MFDCWILFFVFQVDEDDFFEVSSILQSHTQDVNSDHISHQLLVSCSYDCSIRFYRFDGEDWITQQSISDAHQSTVWSADFSGDGNSLVTVGADSVIKIWRRQETGSEASKSKWVLAITQAVSTKWPFYAVSWNKVHEMIAVGGGDGKVRFYRMENAAENSCLEECLSMFKIAAEVNCLSWNPVESSLLAAATDDGEIHVLRIAF